MTLRTARCLLFTLLAAFGAGRSFAQFEFSILGNDQLSNTAIRNALPPEPTGTDVYILRSWEEEARQVVRQLYTQQGYFDAIVDVRVESRSPEGNLVGLVLVEEGERFVIEDIALNAVDGAPLLLTEEDLRVEPGDFFDYEEVFSDRRLIYATYADAGFLKVEVGENVDIQPEDHSVAITYLISRGEAAVFDTLIVRNFEGDFEDRVEGLTRESLLRSLVPYDEGDTITLAANQRVIRMLTSTGVFDSLDFAIEPSPGDSSRTALILTAREADLTRLRTSVFFDARFGIGGSVDLLHANIFGTLNQAGIGALAAQERQSLYTLYSSAITFGYAAFFQNRLEFEWYQDDEIHFVLETPPLQGDFQFRNTSQLALPVNSWSRWSGSLELFARSRLLAPEERRRGLFLNAINAYEISFLDQVLDPTRGTRFTLLWGNGGPLLFRDEITLTENRHNWLETLSVYYYPLVPQLVAAARADGGFFLSEGGINTARFFLGGARTVRSFRFRELCPRTRTVDLNGETLEVCEEAGIVPAYYLGTLEFRVWPFAFGEPAEFGLRPYLQPFSMVLFGDYGNVWDLDEEFTASGPGAGAAFGFGFRYPLARNTTLRLDFAWGWGGKRTAPFAWVVDLANAF